MLRLEPADVSFPWTAAAPLRLSVTPLTAANRRVSNGDQVNRVAALALKRGKSVDFTGYWQRHVAD
jgi:hypothetical protein